MAGKRRPRTQQAETIDLFPTLIDRLADALAALPPDAWRDTHGGGAVASLAERLAAIRHEQTEEQT